jgi:NAD(P)-dependent dehydrogenase (short-subunit alcohol dehydrogenase family)
MATLAFREAIMSCVLVTGSGSGIGLATTLTLARTGHHVYGTMRNPERAAMLRETVNREKLSATVLALDVNSDESVAKAMSAIRSQTGCPDVLVNNAGIEAMGSVEELPFEAFRATMETNYLGALRSIQACLPEMRERRSGCIVNVTSIAGHIASSPMAPYAASKFALEAVSEALAQEVKPFNMRVAIRRAGHNRHSDGETCRGGPGRVSLSTVPAVCRYVRSIAGESDAALARRGEDSRDHRERDMAASPSRAA